MPVHGISCLCFAYENEPELERTRLLCRQKHIPLTLFVHQVHDSSPADENTFALDVLRIEDLLVAREEAE